MGKHKGVSRGNPSCTVQSIRRWRHAGPFLRCYARKWMCARRQRAYPLRLHQTDDERLVRAPLVRAQRPREGRAGRLRRSRRVRCANPGAGGGRELWAFGVQKTA